MRSYVRPLPRASRHRAMLVMVLSMTSLTVFVSLYNQLLEDDFNFRNRYMPPEYSPRTILDTDERILGYLPYAGLTNQFIAFEHGAWLAQHLNRTLLLPPITSNKHDRQLSFQEWSAYFDIPRFESLTGIRVKEWTEAKPMTKSELEIGIAMGRKHKNIAAWEQLAENITCQITRGFGTLRGVDRTFSELFLLRVSFVEPPPIQPLTTEHVLTSAAAAPQPPAALSALSDIVETYKHSTEQSLYMSHTFGLRGSYTVKPWFEIGRHLHFKKDIVELALDLVQSLPNVSTVPILSQSSGSSISQTQTPSPISTPSVSYNPIQSLSLVSPADISSPNPSHSSSTSPNSTPSLSHNPIPNPDLSATSSTVEGTSVTSVVSSLPSPGSVQQSMIPSPHPSSAQQALPSQPFPVVPPPFSTEKVPPIVRRPYIAVHLRRSDIISKCVDRKVGITEKAKETCTPSIERYAAEVEKATLLIKARTANVEPLVVVTTDTTSHEDLVAIANLGWYRVDHELAGTRQRLGIFGAAMVDAVILAHADMLVGTEMSTMSNIAQMRQQSWFNHETFYPKHLS
ncbi:hypothetical protein BG004_006995 [Podila humilis]|nr:hypothetical protein BG004_006995 [Podila humilis]